MKSFKKTFAVALAGLMAVTALVGCGKNENPSQDASGKDIYVVVREDGSGTRGAFDELIGVEEPTEKAETATSTSLVQTTVAGNEAAIGYISLGALDETSVKALKVGGVEATVENIKSGAYTVARPFVICYKEENLTDLGRDFVSFIMSAEGQKILSDNGYIADPDNADPYSPSGLTGKLSLNGSTSVGPVMDKIAEAYKAINAGVTIDVQQTGSGSGIEATIDGSCEIGMSSRDLKDEELAQGLIPVTIAMDGIAVIVNPANSVEDLTVDQIRSIFVGETTNWGDLSE